MWHVYGYPEAQQLLADPVRFSSHTGRLIPESEEFSAGSLTQLDPPRHTKLRKLVNQAFTPRVVAGLEPRITHLATDLLDAAAPGPHRPRRRLRLPAAGDRDRRAARSAQQRPRPVPPLGRHDVLELVRVLAPRAQRT